jgi:hypothetical protein
LMVRKASFFPSSPEFLGRLVKWGSITDVIENHRIT